MLQGDVSEAEAGGDPGPACSQFKRTAFGVTSLVRPTRLRVSGRTPRDPPA